ncbi:KxYKxGKxW signal peptide domain-containing protein [Levilactobacillus tangyuanensis]|nr:LPXTG cell wall anchor domain-containing protein [Levilactobacillus tangyuanensis]
MYFNRKTITSEHRKMYKVGRGWVIGSIATIGLVAGLSVGQPLTASAAEDPASKIEQPRDNEVKPAAESMTVENEPVEPTPGKAGVRPGDAATTTPASLTDSYTDAQKQVDVANGKAQAVNDSLAKLQDLLHTSELTTQANWQERLQAALDEYQYNAQAFGETTAQTQALITAYQAKINETIKDPPNAVKQVTDTETISDDLVDYQKLTVNLQKDVAAQVQTVQSNLANYVVSDQVNQASEVLTGAATALNVGLTNPALTSADLIKLKATYDQALTAYNTVVIAYNDKTGAAMAIISADKNPEITQMLADLQVAEAYSRAVKQYQGFQDKAQDYQAAVSDWQQAVSAYNAALDSLTMAPRANETELQAARQAVEAAAKQIVVVQAVYTEVVQDPQNDVIISAYLDVYQTYLDALAAQSSKQVDYDRAKTNLDNATQQLAAAQAAGQVTTYWEGEVARRSAALAINQGVMDTADQAVADAETAMLDPKASFDAMVKREELVIESFNAALNDLKAKLAVWQNAYTAYETAVTQPVSGESNASDLAALATTVLRTQAAVQAALSAITQSQADYQDALTAYQAALDKSGRTTVKATDGTLPDLASLQTDLSKKIEENDAVLAATPKLLAVIAAQTALQQRSNQINQIVLAINTDQAMLKTIYEAAYTGNIWTVLTDSFQTIGTDLASKATDYQLAINGDDQLASYADLIATLKAANADYGNTDDAYSYPTNDDVTAQYLRFGTSWTSFEPAYQEFLDFLAKSAPTEENNAAVVARMKDGDYLSTNGVHSASEGEEQELGTSHVNISTRYAQRLDDFLGRTVTDWQATTEVQMTRWNLTKFLIYLTDTTPAKSATGSNYLIVSETRKAEFAELLKGMIQPFFVADGTVYHLTALGVPGAGVDGNDKQQLDSLQDVYTFASFDPVGEVMKMFTGMSYNTLVNTSFYFLYTASPQPGVDDRTNLADQATLPDLLPFAEDNLASSGSWRTGSLTAGGTLAAPEPNQVVDSGGTVTGRYVGGETIDNSFSALAVKQAPTISLNQVNETPTGNPGTVDPGPGTTAPGSESPEPGGDQAPGTEPGQPTTLPTDPDNPGGGDRLGSTTEPGPAGKTFKWRVAQVSDDRLNVRLDNRQPTADRALARDHSAAATLPQTGDRSQGILGLIGSLLLALASGSFIKRWHED